MERNTLELTLTSSETAALLDVHPSTVKRWARRADSEDAAELGLPERYLYLYAMLSAFLFPLLANTNGFLQSLLRLLSGTSQPDAQFTQRPSEPAVLVSTGIAMFVLTLMIAYHAGLLRRGERVCRNRFRICLYCDFDFCSEVKS